MHGRQDVRERVERLGRPLNAIVTVLPRGALQGTGPLSGLSLAVKDMIDIAGQPRGNGNPEDMRGPAAEHDAPIVERLRALGADLVATTTLLEYAAGAQHPELPEARNPVAPQLTAGGSSGGSAALVGSGAVPAALGTDTGGSIRLPAHYCGVVGFKPSFGLLPVAGIQPLSPTLDHVGFLTSDVETSRGLLSALTGRPPSNRTDPLRLGVLTSQLNDPRLEPDVREVVWAAVERLLGSVEMVELDGAELDQLNALLGIIVQYESWQIHGETMRVRPEHFGSTTARMFRAAAEVTAGQYEQALSERARLLPVTDALLQGVDALLGPAAPYVAPEISPPGDTPQGAIEGIYSGPYNVTGQPAVVIPCGVTAEGLPVGLQLAAASGADAELLTVAEQVEFLLSPTRAT
ncbi:amidase [Gryllotalpicola sp.]|uniref:amidase n=1 Tax=Gryllotalpicola sp. TaxID=1932787 RepID=UPI00260DF332|nr:amidase [Gryllotalpicola sp.]